MVNRTRFSSIRLFPKFLIALFEWDVVASNNFVEMMATTFDKRLLQTISRVLEILGHGVTWFVGWFVFCQLFRHHELCELELNLLWGLILDIFLVILIKALTRRWRPLPSDDPFSIGPDVYSFPSGHASRTFFVASFLIHLVKVNPHFWTPLLCWATATAISRLVLYRHHIVDVICGALLGLLEMKIVEWLWIGRQRSAEIMSTIVF